MIWWAAWIHTDVNPILQNIHSKRTIQLKAKRISNTEMCCEAQQKLTSNKAATSIRTLTNDSDVVMPPRQTDRKKKQDCCLSPHVKHPFSLLTKLVKVLVSSNNTQLQHSVLTVCLFLFICFCFASEIIQKLQLKIYIYIEQYTT